ncbi:prolyl oligopeptidase family serine peptidase [Amycolatopsis jejuensis]|uniref:alpha/beta hydrolase family protein n=1 Tax=Amycolatopsis jejuensis TaxID=330084 RepID=UPI00138E0EF5
MVAHAERFEPELLLVHGLPDVNVLPAATLRFSDRLTRAGKHHDLVLLPDQGHQLMGAPGEFALSAAARFFVRHLRDRRVAE